MIQTLFSFSVSLTSHESRNITLSLCLTSIHCLFDSWRGAVDCVDAISTCWPFMLIMSSGTTSNGNKRHYIHSDKWHRINTHKKKYINSLTMYLLEFSCGPVAQWWWFVICHSCVGWPYPNECLEKSGYPAWCLEKVSWTWLVV